ncbi:uncharacterized aarF domain-containing protein kinase 5-like isoform X2 [Gordionus sp. m RMFG-2023]|uniref:uncharacterized aarF domain-containing protein kinase 5-like isoform X2 n=1 Tax=Gordionus sp. m RMFG-2023 TaxID=3053472 RepID=UPI0031FC1337
MLTTKFLHYKKIYLIGAAIGIPSLYYLSLTPAEKRKAIVNYGAIVRFFRTFSIGAFISLQYKRKLFFLKENSLAYEKAIKDCHLYGANMILRGCLENGGLYIKLGQGLVAMNHILPKEYTNTLQSLQDKALTQNAKQVDDLFKEDFEGKLPSQIFKEFEMTPRASASLAQVHKAETFDGKSVAVKVQYIDLRDRFNGDMWALRFLMELVTYIHPKFGFKWILDELEDTLAQELDFVHEGKNSERCQFDLKHLKYVYVPPVLWEYCSMRVLTTEWIDGVKINDMSRLESMGFSLKDIDTKLISMFGEQIFCTGFVHADPHPGNILIRKMDKSKTSLSCTPEIVVLDHGLYDYLPPKDRLALCHFWTSILTRDEKKLQKYSNRLGVKDYVSFAEILLQRPLRSFRSLDNLNKGKMSSSSSLFTDKLSSSDLELIKIITKNHFDKIMSILKDMPKQMLLIMRNMNTIRAITLEHGDLVNRYIIMAKKAIKGSLSYDLTKDSNSSNNILTRYTRCICYFLRHSLFEYYLKREIFNQWAYITYVKVLVFLRLMPPQIADLVLYNRYEI